MSNALATVSSPRNERYISHAPDTATLAKETAASAKSGSNPAWQRGLIDQVVGVLYEYRLELAAAFAVFDTNRDGLISASEFYEGLAALAALTGGERITREQAAELMRALDKNDDGAVSYEEFIEGFRLVDTQGGKPVGAKEGAVSPRTGSVETTASVLITPPQLGVHAPQFRRSGA